MGKGARAKISSVGQTAQFNRNNDTKPPESWECKMLMLIEVGTIQLDRTPG